MLDRLITFALQQRVFILAAAVVTAIAGWYAWKELPVEAFPDVQNVQVQVITLYPGQAPEEVERSVTLPIEREMGGVPQMISVRSVTITGLSVVTLTFADGTNDYFARQQVLERLMNVNLPSNVQASLAPLTSAVGEVFRYVIEAPPGMPLREVRALQDWVVRPMLRRVPGIADVISFGGTIKEYQVLLDPFSLRKYGVTIDQLAQALSANSSSTGGGLLYRGDQALVIRSVGLYRDLQDIADTVVTSREGKPILVSDLGRVMIGSRPRSGIVAFNGQDSVVEGIVDMIRGQNPSKIVTALKEAIAGLGARLPKGMSIKPYYDRTDLVKHTVSTVTENLGMGAFLVVAILVLFLRNLYAALTVGVVIPLSLLFAFILMNVRGVAANLISLGAVDFGIIIDSAVVVVEALMVRLAVAAADPGLDYADAGRRLRILKNTAVEMGHPILFSKVIIILAFLPIFTFERVEGKIFSPMAYTLSFALLGAILLTLTLVPVLLSYALERPRLAARLANEHHPWISAVQEHYRRLLTWASTRRAPITAGSVLVLVVALALSPLLGSEFLPRLDEGNIWLTITLPPSASIDQTKRVEREVRRILMSYPEVNNVMSQVGRPDDGTDPKGPNNLEIMSDLKPRGMWRFPTKERMVEDMARKMQAIPGVPTNFSQVIQDNVEEAISGAKGQIVVKIFGPNLDVLEDKGQQVAAVLDGIRGATDVGVFRIGGQTELTITLDRQRMARYGISINDVNSTIQTALADMPVNSFFEGDRQFNVTLRLDVPYRDAVDDIPNLLVALPGGASTIPLSQIARIEVKQGAGRITHEGGGRDIAIKCNLLERDQGSFVAEAMKKVAERVKLPPGYRVTWGGEFENQQRAMARLKVIVPLSVLSIFVLLFWAFRSMKRAMLVILMVPFTLIGGFAGLAVAGLHLSVSAAVGFIAVAGISVQNGVIMVEQIAEFLRGGQALARAVIEGAVLRLRPIVMTALMAGLGLLPAALSHGIGSETQRPFAVVIVGGIISATLFTLLLLPTLFPLFAETGDAGFQDG